MIKSVTMWPNQLAYCISIALRRPVPRLIHYFDEKGNSHALFYPVVPE